MRKLAIAVAGLFIATSLFAQTPHPALLVVDKGANELAIVNPSDMKVIARIPVGEGPHEVATDGKLAFVGNYGGRTPGNTLSIIDLATQKETKRVDLSNLQRPHGLVARGGIVYFTADDKGSIAGGQTMPFGTVSTLEPNTGTVSSWPTSQYATHMLVMSKDGKTIFASNIRSNSISVLTGGKSETIPVGKGPEAIDISPDGREVWTAHSQDGGISIIDTATHKVTQTLQINTKRSNRLKFTVDGKHVLVSDLDAGEVVVLDAASRKEIKRIQTGGHPEGILIVPDGSKAIVAISDQGQVATIDLKSLEVTGKYPIGPDADGMAWAK